MALQAAFIFVAPEADPAKHRAMIDTPIVKLTVVGVKNYAEAIAAAQQLVKQGIGRDRIVCGLWRGRRRASEKSRARQSSRRCGALR